MTTTELKARIEAAALKALVNYAFLHDIELVGTFFYGIRDEQNLQYDKPMPHIYCDPIQDKFNPGTGVIKWLDIRIACLDQDASDNVSEQITGILNRMDWLSLEFIRHLLVVVDDELQDDMEIQRDDFIKFGQGLLTGKLIQIPRLESVEALC